MTNSKLALAAVTTAFLAAAGCSRGSTTDAPAANAAAPSNAAVAAAPAGGGVTEAARAEAKEIFANRCTPCHGANGAGDGAASAGLTPKPRNFQDAAWQKDVTDQHIEQIIKYGGAAVGRSPAMPANPDLAAKDATVTALREHIRTLAK